MANLVVPKQATIHFNDLTGLWSVKMSEQKVDSSGVQQIIEVLHELTSLAQVFSQILAFWALFASDEGEPPGKIAGLVGDLTTALAVPDGFTVRALAAPMLPPPFTDEGELDDTVVMYDGTGDSWGVTPP